MIAKNIPIPAPVAIFKSFGIALIILVLQPTCGREIIKNINPSTKTAANAISHAMPIPSTTENTKYAFKPMPGARAKGKLAQRPITTQPTNAAIAVANSASS